jgi:hypothetical protein
MCFGIIIKSGGECLSARASQEEVSMRRYVSVFVFIAAASLIASESRADTRLTQQQVENTCGSKLQSANGAEGCTKSCGQGGKKLCDYSCNNSGQGRQGCWGMVMSMKAPGGKGPNGWLNRIQLQATFKSTGSKVESKGKASISDFSISKKVDTASPKLTENPKGSPSNGLVGNGQNNLSTGSNGLTGTSHTNSFMTRPMTSPVLQTGH